VPKGACRLGGLDEQIISLYAGGMTVRDIGHHFARTLGTELSHETISNITEAVAEEVTAWQSRPLEAFYPVIYLDALVVKVRDGAHVTNRAAHIAVGVDTDGVKHVLGIWVQATEGAKFWASVCAQLANRGIRDVLIVCCDGLTGFPEAIEATWPKSMVQTCVVHLIRAAMRFVSYADRKAVAAMLRPIYTAPDEDAALMALAAFADSSLGKKYPAAVATFESAWDRFTPFLAFGPALRKVIYTSNSMLILSHWPGWCLDLRFFVLDVSGTRVFGGVSGLVVRGGFRVGLGRVARAGRRGLGRGRAAVAGCRPPVRRSFGVRVAGVA
jgi:putative transposase